MSEKNEKPTPKRLRDARIKGDVAQSKDLAKALLVFGFVTYLVLLGRNVVEEMISMIDWSANHSNDVFATAWPQFIRLALVKLMSVLIPFLLITVTLSFIGQFLQVGFLVAPEKIKPSLNRLSIIKNLKNWFSAQNLIEAAKSVAKVIVLSVILWNLIKNNIGPLLLLPPSGINALSRALDELLRVVMLSSGIVFLVFGGADWLIQRVLFMRRHRMSKEDLKNEYKASEGDPHVKHQRKQLYRELLSGARTRKASAVVVNPVHYAVAIGFHDGNSGPPRVFAKGKGHNAREMVSTAKKLNITIIENVPLARALYADATVEEVIPAHLVEAVIEVLSTLDAAARRWH